MWRKTCISMLLMGILLLPIDLVPLPGSRSMRAARVSAGVAPHLGYGFMLAHTAHLDHVSNAGFDWFKYFVNWDAVDGNRDRVYNWATVDAVLNDACAHNLNVLLRVGRASDNWAPIRDGEMAGWETFFGDLTTRIVQRRAGCSEPYRVALEIWNEPNLDFQWGGEPVDPARYTEMVKRAYRGVKAVDPHLIVVAGSLAPTGGLPGGQAMDDVAFLYAMYAAGLKGHFDAISIHNYGFGRAPEEKEGSHDILTFRRAEDVYAAMVAHGDGDKPVWGTEFGWLLQAEACSAYWDSIGFGWHQVTASQQADYLVRAFAYADANWPWMQVLIVSNLDFAVMEAWYPTCEPLRWFGVLEPQQAPRPAYTALAQMEKRPRSWQVWGMEADPATLSWMMLLAETRSVSRTVTVRNTGDLPFRWAATVDSPGLPTGNASPLAVTVDPAEGDCDHAFTVTLDGRGLPAGTHTATIRITADQVTMPDNPRAIPVTLHVVEQLHTTFIPQVQRTR
jgi:hypothetical protein